MPKFLLAWGFCLAASLSCTAVPFPFTLPLASASPTQRAIPPPTASATDTPTQGPTRTPSPTLIPGIEEPVKVGDAQLLISKALRRDNFRCGNNSEPVEDPETEEFLLLVLEVVDGPSVTTAQFSDWFHENRIDRITLQSESSDGRGSVQAYWTLCYTRNSDTYVLTEIVLGYVIRRDAIKFLVGMPDGTAIPLDSLLP